MSRGKERADVDKAQRENESDQGRRIEQDRKERLQGGEISDWEHFCRGATVRNVDDNGIDGSRVGYLCLPGRSRSAGHFARRIAVAKKRSNRHHPSGRLQLLREARDQDRVSTGLDETIVQA